MGWGDLASVWNPLLPFKVFTIRNATIKQIQNLELSCSNIQPLMFSGRLRQYLNWRNAVWPKTNLQLKLSYYQSNNCGIQNSKTAQALHNSQFCIQFVLQKPHLIKTHIREVSHSNTNSAKNPPTNKLIQRIRYSHTCQMSVQSCTKRDSPRIDHFKLFSSQLFFSGCTTYRQPLFTKLQKGVFQ